MQHLPLLNNKSFRLPAIFSVVILTLALVLLYTASTHDKENGPALELDTLKLVGSYVTSDGTYTLTDESHISSKQYNDVCFIGHFNKNIPEGTEILVRIPNIYCRMFVNGSCVLDITESKAPDYTRSAGNHWERIISDGITTADEIEIYLSSVYPDASANRFDKFIHSMYIGCTIDLYYSLVSSRYHDLASSVLLICLGLLMYIMSFAMRLMKLYETDLLLSIASIATLTGMWYLGDYDVLCFALPFPTLMNIIDAVVVTLMPASVSFCAYSLITGRRRSIALVMTVLFTFIYCTFSILQLGGFVDFFDYYTEFLFMNVISFAIAVILILMELKKNLNTQKLVLVIALLPTVLTAALDMADFAFNLYEYKHLYRNGLCITFLLLLPSGFLYYRDLYKSAHRAAELEKELANSRIDVTLSQIKPHFLYNALYAIQHICATDPQKAERAIENFSKYLRGNLDSISTDRLIPFNQELKHIMNYVHLEQLRFGERVQVRYNITSSDFLVPPLTVQPIVENAIRYGITKKADGGVVIIHTYETEEEYVVSVNDDGVGFNSDTSSPDASKSHIGMQNVRNRLQLLCGGRLEVLEADGFTSVLLHLPKNTEKGVENNADNGSRRRAARFGKQRR